MQIEILAPAGNEQSFNAAVNAGAHAIYLGLKEFSARGSAENFSLENLDFYLKKAHFFSLKENPIPTFLDIKIPPMLYVINKYQQLCFHKRQLNHMHGRRTYNHHLFDFLQE